MCREEKNYEYVITSLGNIDSSLITFLKKIQKQPLEKQRQSGVVP